MKTKRALLTFGLVLAGGLAAGCGDDAPTETDDPNDCEGAIAFPDPALRTLLGEMVGWPEEITDEDVTDISELDAGDQEINDLRGLQCLQALTVLSLRRNEIIVIDSLAELSELTSLDLSGNWISDISALAELTSLTELRLGANNVSDLSDLSGLTSLTTLELSDNAVTDLGPLVENSGLDSGDELWLTGNPIDCTAQADSIQALRDRGVTVNVDCP